MMSNTSGSYNTASGWNSLVSNTTGSNNTAIGRNSGSGPNGATSGSGSANTFLGAAAGVSTSKALTNATAIGANARVGTSNSLVLSGNGANAVNVGIGTTTPHSSLQVVGTYAQFPTITGGTPPASDCATAADAGRIVVRTDGVTNLYVCTGTAGWVGK